jgi:hypothetical protein
MTRPDVRDVSEGRTSMLASIELPLYLDLDRPDETGLPLVRGLWGLDDELGMLNNITPKKAVEAAGLVKEGRRFNLDLPLDLPWGGFQSDPGDERFGPRHVVTCGHLAHIPSRDDHLEGFYLQASSQWDGLTHMADPVHGFYNTPREPGPLPIWPRRCGIDRVSDFGIFTRGVLADIPTYFASIGRRWSVVGRDVVSVGELRACLKWQGTAIGPGDMLLVRSGWLTAFLEADLTQRRSLFKREDYSGVSGSEEMWAFLWDFRIAGIVSDSVTVEAFPPRDKEPSLHWAIPRLGLTLGELFFLDDLAEACRKKGNFEFLFVGKPLNLTGGVGSPANAMAIV